MPDQSRVPRGSLQSMGIWLSEPLLRDPEKLKRSIATLAESGYDVIRLFVRNTNFTHRSPEIVSLVSLAVDLAHKLGLKAVLDCEPHVGVVGPDMGRVFPEAMGSLLVRATARVVDGHWRLRVENPPLHTDRQAIFDGIEAAFLKTGGEVRKVELPYAVDRETQAAAAGDNHREATYREGVAISMGQVAVLHGQLDGVSDAELQVYVRFSAIPMADFWSEGFTRYYDELLACYRDVPLDGVGWDEPGTACDWRVYRYGDGFARAFERLNGYRLADNLYRLDEDGMEPESVKVRLDYYRTLNEGIAQAQARLIAKARECFGPDLILGTHHTWQGEGGSNDYRAGAVDYFRLNDAMDAGYTDCCWWDRASVCYAYTLASSLGRLHTPARAEVNTWHFKPTVMNTRANVALMSVMNVDWYNIWFGGDSDCIMAENHYTWPAVVKAMHAHKAIQAELHGLRPACEVAVWHGWEGVCAWNSHGIANVHKAFCLNTSELLMRRGITADFIDSRLLEDSRVEGRELVNALGRYTVLVIPYALAMPRQAFETCRAFAKAGGRVVFVGTPVFADDSGRSLGKDFATLFGIPEMTASHYMAGLLAVCRLPPYRPQRLEVCRPLARSLPNTLVSCEGEIHGLKAQDEGAVFLTDLDPQERLIEAIEDRLSQRIVIHGANVIGRLYQGEGREALAVGSWDGLPLRGIVRWNGRLLELNGGTSGVITLRDSTFELSGDLLASHGDAKL